MVAPQITALPDPPSRADPSTFADKADAFLGALPDFATETNTVADFCETKASEALTSANTATTQAGIATTAANTATTQANNASNSAQLAEQSIESYQGVLASDPTLDKEGNPLTAGDWYVNTISGLIRAYNGAAWVNSVNVTAGVSNINGETGAVTGYVKETGAQSLSTKTFTTPRYTVDDDGSITGGTWTIDYNNGPLIKATVGAAITSITLSNLPTSGTLGHLKLMLINPGAFAITFPASWKFIKNDFTTTDFAGLGITLPASGVVFFDLLTDDAGSNVYVTISRN